MVNKIFQITLFFWLFLTASLWNASALTSDVVGHSASDWLSSAKPDGGGVSPVLESYHPAAIIGYDGSPAALAYDVDIPISTTGTAPPQIVSISTVYSYDCVPVSPFRAGYSPRGPPPEFGSFLAVEGGILAARKRRVWFCCLHEF